MRKCLCQFKPTAPLQIFVAVVNINELVCQSQIVMDEYTITDLHKKLNAICQ